MPEHNHKFRFGIRCTATSRRELVEQARKAEDLGFSTLLFTDHLDDDLAPLIAMAIAAEATKTLRVGSYVLGNDFRHPVMLAQEAATLDLLSEGRLELGLGTGWQRSDYDQSGIPLDPPHTRVSRLEEAIQVIKGAFTGSAYSFSGHHYHVSELIGAPVPRQKPHPPLLIGGGSKRILSIAAREADIIGFNARTTAEGSLDLTSLTADATAEKVGWVRQAAGERFGALELNVLVARVTVTDTPRETMEEAIRASERRSVLTVDQWLESPVSLVGSVDQMVLKLQGQRDRLGISYIGVTAEMDAVAPIVARLSGT